MDVSSRRWLRVSASSHGAEQNLIANGVSSSCCFVLVALSEKGKQPDPANNYQSEETHKRPVGDAAAQKCPIDLTAITIARKKLRNGATDGQLLNHAVKVATAAGKLRRIPLQPALAGRNESAQNRKNTHQGQSACMCCALGQCRTDEGGQGCQHEAVTGDYAHGAGMQSHHALQIQAKQQHAT